MVLNEQRIEELLEKANAVSHHMVNTAEALNAGYKTNDFKLANYIAELLLKLVTAWTPDKVDKLTDLIMKTYTEHPIPVEQFTFIALNINWLSWGWHEQDEPELTEAWAKAWYKVNDFAMKTLKGDDLSYYIKTTD